MKTPKVCHLPAIHTVTEVKSCLLGEEAFKSNSTKGVGESLWKRVRVSGPDLAGDGAQWVAAFFIVFLSPNVAINFHMDEWTLAEMERRCCS